MSDPMLAIPDPFACCELECVHLEGDTLDYCERERHCPYAHQRRREEDLIEREAKEAINDQGGN